MATTTQERRIVPWTALATGAALAIVVAIPISLLIRAILLAAFEISDDAASGPAVLALALMHVATAGAVLAILIPFVKRRMPESG